MRHLRPYKEPVCGCLKSFLALISAEPESISSSSKHSSHNGFHSTLIIFICTIRLLRRKIYTIVHNRQTDAALGFRHNAKLPPGLTKRWPLGIDRIMELWRANADGYLLEFLYSIAGEYDHEDGNSGCQYLLVGARSYYVMHLHNLETVLPTNFKHYGFGNRLGVSALLLGKGIVTQEGEARRHSRKLLRKQFIRVQYQNMDNFREHFDNLAHCLPTDKTVDPQPLSSISGWMLLLPSCLAALYTVYGRILIRLLRTRSLQRVFTLLKKV